MIAPILALETFRDHVRNKDVILLIDSEAVEASLVKGYSSKEDLCELVELFWELSLEYRASFFSDRVSTDANPASPDRRVGGVGDGTMFVACGSRMRKGSWA